MPRAVNPFPTLHVLVFVPTIAIIFKGNFNGKNTNMMCENKDLVEEYAHFPLDAPMMIRSSGGLAACQGIGSICYPITSIGCTNSRCLSGGNCQVP